MIVTRSTLLKSFINRHLIRRIGLIDRNGAFTIGRIRYSNDVTACLIL